MAQPWEMDWTPRQAAPTTIGPDPVLAQRAQQEEERKRAEEARQAEQLRLSQESSQRAAAENARQQAEFEGTAGKPTEVQGKAGTFLIRALGANRGYEDTGEGARNIFAQSIQDYAPNVANSVLNSDARQVANSAQNEFVAATLRMDSGAAIPPEELEAQRRIYFPMPGDGPAAIEQKRQARQRAIEGLRMLAGPLRQQAEQRYSTLEQQFAQTAPPSPGTNLGRDVGNAIGAGVTAPPGGSNPPAGPQGPPLNPQQQSAYDAFLQANPDATADQLRAFGQSIGVPIQNADDIVDYRKKYGTVAPGSTATFGEGQPSEPNFLSQLGTATQNTLAGVAEGVGGTYDMGMKLAFMPQQLGSQALMRGGSMAAGALGATDAASALSRAADNSSNFFNQATDTAGLVQRLSPTPPGMEPARFAANLIGGALVPGPKFPRGIRAPAALEQSAARDVINAGAQNGVRVMTSDVRPPTTFIGRVARSTAERIPYAGTGGPRAAQQAERVQAVRNLAQEYGVEADGALLNDVAADLAKTRGGAISALTRTKDKVIDGVQAILAPTDVQRTLEAINAQVQRLSGIDAEAYKPVIDRLTQFGANLASGKTLRQVEGNRKLLGDLFSDPNLASIKGDGQKAINAIYAPLREDMGAFIEAHGGNRAAWAKANDRLSAMAGELSDNAFRGVLQSAETTPENVARLLASRKPSDVQRLISNLSPEGKRKAQGAIIQQAIERAGGLEDISPDRFANQIGSMSRAIGVAFDGGDLARVKGLARLLQTTKQANVASAAPPTGVQNVPFLMGAGVGATGGTGAVVLGAFGGLARLYESPVVRNLLIPLGKAKPGSKAEANIMARIMRSMTTQASPALGRAFNDNLPITAQSAAQDRDSYQR